MRRRTILAGLGVLAVAAGGAAWKLQPFRKQYPPTPYDDVLSHLDDRDWAAKFGVTALAAMPGFTPATGAVQLRALLARNDLKTVALRDADAGRLVEIGGWLVPQSIALIAALAKSVAP
jgi:hypothetical protein